MHYFDNIKCLVHARHRSGNVMVNDIDKTCAVMETHDGTMLENDRVQVGRCG